MTVSDVALDPGTIGDVGRPRVPPSTPIEIPDLGTLPVRDLGHRPHDTPVMLFHGWTATADLNWFRCYQPLADHHRIIAYDQRGHGLGVRSKKRFRLEDCADDAIAVADALGIDRFVPVGYSMGGAIAQLIWRRHPNRVRGLVLCATAPVFSVEPVERLSFLGASGLAALARITPGQARSWLTDQLYLQRKSREWEPWAVELAASHDWRMVLEAGTAIGGFDSTSWIADVDVPVGLVITMRDRVIGRRRQTMFFEALPRSVVFRVDGEHDAAVEASDQFVASLLRAIAAVSPAST